MVIINYVANIVESRLFCLRGFYALTLKKILKQ